MNQILISEKLYVTSDMKRKKIFFKIQFIFSVFLLCIFSSYYIYAEYDKQQQEQVSQEILSNMEFVESEPIEETIVVILNSALNQEIDIDEMLAEGEVITEPQLTVAEDGTEYYTIGIINIPKINVNYPILSETTEKLLKISPCKFCGPNPNQIGNLCLVGHNYKNSKFFSKIPTLEIGDIIEITDISGKTITYEIYDKYIVEPEDLSCTSQKTNNEKHVTLITCTNNNKQRWVIKSKEQIT